MDNEKQYPFRTKRVRNRYSILIAVLSCLLLLAVCIFPFSVPLNMALQAVEVNSNGNIIHTGNIVLNLTIRHYLLRPTEAVIENIDIMDLDISSHRIPEVLQQHNDPVSVDLISTYLKKGNTPYALRCYLFFNPQDPSFAIIKTDGRLFVGTSLPGQNPQDILKEYEILNF